MTTLATNLVFSPVVAPLVSKDKGDVSNRVRCSGAQLFNNASTAGQLALVGGGTYALGKTIVKHPDSKVVKVIGNAYAKFINAIANSKIGAKFVESVKKVYLKLPQILDKCNKLPMKARGAIAALVLSAMLVTGFIAKNHVYKTGQIDQKYTDQAKLEENKKNILA